MSKKDDSMTPLGQTLPLGAAAANAIEAPPADPSDPGPEDPKVAAAFGPAAGAPIAPASGAVVTREDFGGMERLEVVETASVALAAQAKAEVEARYVMALKRPRDIDVFRQQLLKDCKRASFAEIAEYSKPIGGKRVTGASIRFIETALRHYGNCIAASAAVYDDASKRIVRVTVTDLETNFTVPMDITIEKTVERSQPRKGGDGQAEFLASRRNSNNSITYLVVATEDDMLNKERALISKAIRTNGERLLPPDIKEEALRLCRTTLRDRATKDPDAERRAIADAFADLNVSVPDLKEYLGHDLDKSSPAEMVDLRQVWTALRDGQTTWAEVMAAKKSASSAGGPAVSKAESVLGKLGTKPTPAAAAATA